jgi:hypothetical protein
MYLATNDLATLGKPVDLVSCFALAGGRVRDSRAEAFIRRIEYVLAERTRRLQFPLLGATDNPTSRQQRVPLSRALLQEINLQRSHTTRVGGIRDPTRLWDREMVSDALVRE